MYTDAQISAYARKAKRQAQAERVFARLNRKSDRDADLHLACDACPPGLYAAALDAFERDPQALTRLREWCRCKGQACPAGYDRDQWNQAQGVCDALIGLLVRAACRPPGP